MAENQIKIEISAGTDELIKALQSADKAAVKFSGSVVSSIKPIETAAKSASNSIGDGFGKAFSSIAKGVAIGGLVEKGVLGAFNAITNFASGTVAAAEEQEIALNKLGQALKASGSYSEQAMSEFAAYASELQKTSVYGDEVVLAQVAMAKSFGASNEEAKKLVTAAANLASTFGGSLEERVQQLGKTLDGSAGKLAKFVPELKGLTSEQLKAAGAADIINSKFNGAAANELNTYSGKVIYLKNAVSDFQEELGGLFTQSTLVAKATAAFTSIFQRLTEQMVASKTESKANADGYVKTQTEVEILAEKYSEATTRLEKYNRIVEMAKNGKGAFDSITVSDAKTKVEELTTKLQTMYHQISISQAAVARAEERAKALAGDKGTDKDTQTTDEKAKAAKIIADKAALNQQLLQQDADFEAYKAQLKIQSDTITQEQRTIEMENLRAHELEKIEAVRMAEIAKAQIITDEGLKQATIKAANRKAEIDADKVDLAAQDKFAKAQLKLDQDLAAAKHNIMSQSFQLAAALAKNGSQEQFLIQKAAALAEIAVARGKAIAMIPGQTAHMPFPTNLPAVAQLTANANIQAAIGAAIVAATAMKGFEQGGIVGGSSWHGDNIPVRVNSGEMILNRNQQSELFRAANGEGSGTNGGVVSAIRELITEVRSMPIVVQANGREIARLIRDEQSNGFEVFS